MGLAITLGCQSFMKLVIGYTNRHTRRMCECVCVRARVCRYNEIILHGTNELPDRFCRVYLYHTFTIRMMTMQSKYRLRKANKMKLRSH